MNTSNSTDKADPSRAGTAATKGAWFTALLAMIQAAGLAVVSRCFPYHEGLTGFLPFWVLYVPYLLLLVLQAVLSDMGASRRVHAALRGVCWLLLIPTLIMGTTPFRSHSCALEWELGIGVIAVQGLACIGVCLFPFIAFEDERIESRRAAKAVGYPLEKRELSSQ